MSGQTRIRMVSPPNLQMEAWPNSGRNSWSYVYLRLDTLDTKRLLTRDTEREAEWMNHSGLPPRIPRQIAYLPPFQV